MSKKRSSTEPEGYWQEVKEKTEEEEPGKKKSNAGRPKNPPKLDIQYKKKFEELMVAITTLKDTLGDGATDDILLKALKKKFPEGLAGQGEGILQFLQEDTDRNNNSLAEKEGSFQAKLTEYKTTGTYSTREDAYISSIRKADLVRLEEHSKFLEVCQEAIVFYKELFIAEKSEPALNNLLIKTALEEIKSESISKVRDTSKFASVQSQDMNDGFGDDDVMSGL